MWSSAACSPSASGFDVLCVQRWYSAYLGCTDGTHPDNTSNRRRCRGGNIQMCIYYLLPLSGALTTDFEKYEYERVGAHSFAFALHSAEIGCSWSII